MIKIQKIKKTFIVKEDNYSVKINSSGTIRKLFFGGIDTGLTREGCEYWIDDGRHFQQEFGGVVNSVSGRNSIELTASMKNPKGKKAGGTCTAKYHFKKSSITIESTLTPRYKPLSYNKYVCFCHKSYTHYSYDGKDFKEIDKSRLVDSEAKSITLKKGDKLIKIKCLSPISEMRLYKTSSMVEIKPNWTDDKMKIEICMVVAENKIKTENTRTSVDPDELLR